LKESKNVRKAGGNAYGININEGDVANGFRRPALVSGNIKIASNVCGKSDA
jgi:hypothetical protein